MRRWTPTSSRHRRGISGAGPDMDAVAHASELLSQAENPVIVIGDRIAQSAAVPEMGKVAEQLGAKVYAAAYTEVNFPTSHSLFGGMLNLNSAATRQQLAAADVVLAVGTNVFSFFLYMPEPFIGPSTKLIHLDSNAREVEKIYPTEVGILVRPQGRFGRSVPGIRSGYVGTGEGSRCHRAATLAEERSRYHQGAEAESQGALGPASHGRRAHDA